MTQVVVFVFSYTFWAILGIPFFEPTHTHIFGIPFLGFHFFGDSIIPLVPLSGVIFLSQPFLVALVRGGAAVVLRVLGVAAEGGGLRGPVRAPSGRQPEVAPAGAAWNDSWRGLGGLCGRGTPVGFCEVGAFGNGGV